MSRPKKHASGAQRQAAYRARCRHARQIELSARGLPPLPSVPSMPGWPRWNAAFRLAHGLIEGAERELQDYFDARSESWQESERGEEHQERMECVESVLDALEPLIT